MRAAFLALLLAVTSFAQDDVADVPNRKVELGDGLEAFVIGEQKKTPKGGYKVVVVLPGGSGSADFNAFVRRMWKFSAPKGYLFVQLVSRTWRPEQKTIWPTEKLKAPGMKVTTEEHLTRALKHLKKKKVKVDKKRIFTLSWSSGGPAAYQVSVTNKAVRGSFVVMSVFRPEWMAGLKGAKKHAYYLLHSRTDDVCPFSHAEKAKKDLGKAGAKTELVEYEGGHAWPRTVYADVKKGLAWLEKNAR